MAKKTVRKPVARPKARPAAGAVRKSPAQKGKRDSLVERATRLL